ncbi:hypothetical protein GW932_01285 [archaeon]|nr:hypothetical protein [archaeon]
MNKFKETIKPALEFLKDKRVQNIIVVILFLATLFIGINIRTQDLPNLIDKTTGDYTPLALDPYYFLRVSETLHDNNGVLPAVDTMRYQALNSTWTDEILPQSTLFLHKIISVISPDSTIRFANVLNPVIFFALGLIVFFFLVLLITKNKWIATISSFILTIIPPYLYRTLAGFSDHEAIGMFAFFLALISFAWGMVYLEKKKKTYVKSGLYGLIAGFMTIFAIAAWGGGAKFLFMIFPLAYIVIWFIKDNKSLWNRTLFYGTWVFGVLIFTPLFGYSILNILKSYMLNLAGILTLFVLGYSLIETIILKSKLTPKIIQEKKEISSFILVTLIGGIFYQIVVGNVFHMIGSLLNSLLYPFGTGRVGLTVAENKQPYLTELIGQVGKTVFYTFLIGCFIVGGKLANGIRNKKYRYLFTASFAFFIIGILASRTSDTSIFNGENFISKALFFLSFLAIAISSVYIYRKSDWTVDMRWVFIAAWMIPMLLSVRSAIRVFFAIVPFISMMVPIAIFETAKWGRKNKDDLLKTFSIILVLFVTVMLIFVSVGFYKSDVYQAKVQTPSYNTDWQNAMSWVRANTQQNAIFLHWWDYGYWVQTGGERPTLTDGGHFNGYWDHLVGRYVLTTPYPETAKSFMKTQNISYLLIDPTDIGKYSAFSSIADDLEISDRASWLPTFVSDISQTQETRTETIRIYQGGTYIDSDIRYKENGTDIFLPKGKAAILGVILTKSKDGVYSQPIGVFGYNNKQYRIPLKKLSTMDKYYEFNEGIEGTVHIYPNVYSSAGGQKIDSEGALMYFSEKTQDSLIAQLYVMNDPENRYSELELVHEESQYPLTFYYGGFSGPIKIYKVHTEEMDNILTHEEFKAVDGEYGELDDLQFIKN